MAEFYERAYASAFTAAAVDSAAGAGAAGSGGRVRVLLATAQLADAEAALAACRAWTPRGASRPALCEGTAFADGGMPGDVAALRRATVLVRTLCHG